MNAWAVRTHADPLDVDPPNRLYVIYDTPCIAPMHTYEYIKMTPLKRWSIFIYNITNTVHAVSASLI